MKSIILYVGRFQPMLKHHRQVYKNLINQGHQVKIVTSNKVQYPDSPFSFNEKKQIIESHGIPSHDIIMSSTPYKIDSLLETSELETSSVVYIIGEKDKDRFKTKKLQSDGKPWFLETKNLSHNPEPANKHSYYYVVSNQKDLFENKILSATDIRKQLSDLSLTQNQKKQLFIESMGFYDKKICELVTNRLVAINSDLINFFSSDTGKKLLKEVSSSGTFIVDDGPRFLYGNYDSYKHENSDYYNSIGMSIVNYLIDDQDEIFVHDTGPGKGPVGDTSFYSSGKEIHSYRTNFSNIKAFKYWKQHIARIATQLGFEFVKFKNKKTS